MRAGATRVDKALAVVAGLLALLSIYVGDADKTPLYGLLAYVLWRLG